MNAGERMFREEPGFLLEKEGKDHRNAISYWKDNYEIFLIEASVL